MNLIFNFFEFFMESLIIENKGKQKKRMPGKE